MGRKRPPDPVSGPHLWLAVWAAEKPTSKRPTPAYREKLVHPHRSQFPRKLANSGYLAVFTGLFGGPTRIRTWNQGIRVFRRFPSGADYLFTLRLWRVGCGTLEPVIKGAEALR